MKDVKALYDEVPFSAYGLDYFPVLKSLGKPMNELKPFFKGKRAIEVGCGAGHIASFLADFFTSVKGVDLSEKSIELARSEAKKRKTRNVEYENADLFDQNFLLENSMGYDFVLCYGVLHHTKSPRAGFGNLVGLLKPGGIVTVGVYSRTELEYRIERKIALAFGGSDPRKREELANRLFFGGKGKRLALSDGFGNPQVSFHSISDVMGWIRDNKLEYLGSFPPIEISKTPEVFYRKFIRRQASVEVQQDKPSGIRKLIDYNPVSYLLVEVMWAISRKSVMLSVSARKPKSP